MSSSSSSELILRITKNSPFPSSKAILWTTRNRRRRPQFFSISSIHNKKQNEGLSCSSLKFKEIHSISCSSSTSESSLFQESEGDTTEASSNEEIKFVQVKFQLIKDCLFGQDIQVVGDDPIFGLWDPSNAVPLEWSDGHLWSVQLDVPINKSIHFKFILKEPTGEVIWQPGEDRILRTWETDKTIVIFEDWENVELKMVTEEESVAKTNITQEGRGNSIKEDLQSDLEDPVVNSNTSAPTISPVITTEKLAYPEAEQTDNEKTSTSLKAEDTLFQYEGEPVLVPGLAPLSTATVEEGLPRVFTNDDVTVETPTTTSNVVDVEVKAETPTTTSDVLDVEVKAVDQYKPEKQENEDLGQYTRTEPVDLSDEEQGAGVGVGEDCQSCDEEMEVLELPSTDDADILKNSLQSDDSFMHKLIRSLGFIIDQMN